MKPLLQVKQIENYRMPYRLAQLFGALDGLSGERLEVQIRFFASQPNGCEVSCPAGAAGCPAQKPSTNIEIRPPRIRMTNRVGIIGT
jgi:hypothetical protein